MRLFLAIELSDPVRAKLLSLSQLIRDSRPQLACSWTRAENLHLTLKFLGRVEEAQVAGLCDALAQVRAAGPIELMPARIECLPPRGPVRVISIGLTGESAPLAELHRQIERRCLDCGFPAEARMFRPHITLARARRPLAPGMRKSLEEIARAKLPTAPLSVSEFVLMESRLKPDATEYIPLARFSLRGIK